MRELWILMLCVCVQACSSANNCDQLPTIFTSYRKAKNSIENTRFNFTDNFNTARSSWIKGAKYYSCDSKNGFFILQTDGEAYVYQNLPIAVWYAFKNAPSLGKYYHQHIKKQYSLQVINRN